MFSKPYTDGPQFKQLSFNGVYILLEFDNINQVTLQIWFCWSPNVFKTLFLLLKLSPYYKYQTKEKYVNLYVSINCIKNKNVQHWRSMIPSCVVVVSLLSSVLQLTASTLHTSRNGKLRYSFHFRRFECLRVNNNILLS